MSSATHATGVDDDTQNGSDLVIGMPISSASGSTKPQKTASQPANISTVTGSQTAAGNPPEAAYVHVPTSDSGSPHSSSHQDERGNDYTTSYSTLFTRGNRIAPNSVEAAHPPSVPLEPQFRTETQEVSFSETSMYLGPTFTPAAEANKVVTTLGSSEPFSRTIGRTHPNTSNQGLLQNTEKSEDDPSRGNSSDISRPQPSQALAQITERMRRQRELAEERMRSARELAEERVRSVRELAEERMRGAREMLQAHLAAENREERLEEEIFPNVHLGDSFYESPLRQVSQDESGLAVNSPTVPTRMTPSISSSVTPPIARTSVPVANTLAPATTRMATTITASTFSYTRTTTSSTMPARVVSASPNGHTPTASTPAPPTRPPPPAAVPSPPDGTPPDSPGTSGDEATIPPLFEFRRIRVICFSQDHSVGEPFPPDMAIFINQSSTFKNVLDEIEKAKPGQWSMLQANYGPWPYWTVADLKSTIAPICRTLYAVNIEGGVQYLMAVLRTAQADRPLVIFNPQRDRISQAIHAADPNFSGKLRVTEHPNGRKGTSAIGTKPPPDIFPTEFVITDEDKPQPMLQLDASSTSIPPFLRAPFVNCKNVLRKSYKLKHFTTDMIHLSSVVLHTIISLAMEVKSDQLAGDELEVLHDVSFLMADNLKGYVNELSEIVDDTEGNTLDEVFQKKRASILDDLCGEYPGAVAVRYSCVSHASSM